ncbi:MAG: serine acetyltransferase [Phycisphaerae bacterium]|nr:serine acetyltransferase [Phycisphaerae bacterium]
MWRKVREDYQTCGRHWSQPGFRAVAVYRFGVWAADSGPLRPILIRLYHFMYRYVRNHYGIDLYRTTQIGRRCWIAHHGGIVIHPKAVIGDDCLIRHNVTIGAATHDRAYEAPKLGNKVEIGVGAAILGSITVGDGARIGPGAIVMTNVPPGATVFANPGRIIPPTSEPPKEDAK